MTLRWAPSLLMLVVLTTCAPVAHAYHTDRTRVVPGTAFTLHQGEWQLGPFRADYAPLENLQIGTYVVPWFSLFPNLQLKMLLFRNERWAVSIRPGLFYANFDWPRRVYGIGIEDTSLKLWVIPLEGYVTMVIRRRFMLTAAGVYNVITGKGTYDPDDFRGTAAASNAQVGMDFQWRINRVVSLILQGRLVAYQENGGVGYVDVSVDESTNARIEAQGGAAAFDTGRGFSASIATFLSWEHLNVRLGVGYGNYNVPGFNVVIPELYPFPVFDLFWRFGAKPQRLSELDF